MQLNVSSTSRDCFSLRCLAASLAGSVSSLGSDNEGYNLESKKIDAKSARQAVNNNLVLVLEDSGPLPASFTANESVPLGDDRTMLWFDNLEEMEKLDDIPGGRGRVRCSLVLPTGLAKAIANTPRNSVILGEEELDSGLSRLMMVGVKPEVIDILQSCLLVSQLQKDALLDSLVANALPYGNEIKGLQSALNLLTENAPPSEDLCRLSLEASVKSWIDRGNGQADVASAADWLLRSPTFGSAVQIMSAALLPVAQQVAADLNQDPEAAANSLACEERDAAHLNESTLYALLFGMILGYDTKKPIEQLTSDDLVEALKFIHELEAADKFAVFESSLIGCLLLHRATTKDARNVDPTIVEALGQLAVGVKAHRLPADWAKTVMGLLRRICLQNGITPDTARLLKMKKTAGVDFGRMSTSFLQEAVDSILKIDVNSPLFRNVRGKADEITRLHRAKNDETIDEDAVWQLNDERNEADAEMREEMAHERFQEMYGEYIPFEERVNMDDDDEMYRRPTAFPREQPPPGFGFRRPPLQRYQGPPPMRFDHPQQMPQFPVMHQRGRNVRPSTQRVDPNFPQRFLSGQMREIPVPRRGRGSMRGPQRGSQRSRGQSFAPRGGHLNGHGSFDSQSAPRGNSARGRYQNDFGGARPKTPNNNKNDSNDSDSSPEGAAAPRQQRGRGRSRGRYSTPRSEVKLTLGDFLPGPSNDSSKGPARVDYTLNLAEFPCLSTANPPQKSAPATKNLTKMEEVD